MKHSLFREPASRVFFVACLFLFLSLLVVWLIDYHNFAGSRDLLAQRLEIPYFWYHWFLVPLEIPLQWYLLGAALIFFLLNAGIALERQQKDIYLFWLISGTGVVLMFAEDAGDVRHALRHYVEKLTGEGTYGVWGSSFELLYFVALAGIITYALVRYHRVWLSILPVRRFFVIAYLMYGLSVASSFAGAAYKSATGMDLYTQVGHILMHRWFVTDPHTLQFYENATQYARIDFCLMDMLWEESLEFVGAAALLAAAMAFFYRDRNTPGRTS